MKYDYVCEQILDLRQVDDTINIVYNLNINSFLINQSNSTRYKPAGTTLKRFHQDSDKMIRLLFGAFRSGKSTAACAEILFRTVNMPKMLDGMRRAKWAIIRNTMGELETTTVKTWLRWFEKLGRVKRTKKPVLSYTYNFNDKLGKIDLELIFIGLDRENDKEKLESLELTGAYINELQHIPKGIFSHVIGRIGQYPSQAELGSDSNCCWLLADTNPPDEDHWIYQYFEKDCPSNAEIYKQPPGLIKNVQNEWIDNSNADNIKNLRKSYYSDLARGNNFNEEFIKVYCRGEYGIVKMGNPVFHEYNDDLHSINELVANSDLPIYIFWDYGLTPCALICQFSEDTQFRALKEFVSRRSGVRQLAKNYVMPYLMANFEGKEFISIGDPAGVTPSPTNLETCMEALEEEGLPTDPAITNNIEDRLNAVRDFLNRLIEGQPAFLLSRTGCPTLRKALIRQYCYKRIRVIGDEKYHEKPDKTHPWSDIADCLEYGALEFNKCLKMIQTSPNQSQMIQTIGH